MEGENDLMEKNFVFILVAQFLKQSILWVHKLHVNISLVVDVSYVNKSILADGFAIAFKKYVCHQKRVE